jgi:predicted ATPase
VFVGRREESRRLWQALNAVSAGEPTAVLVAGDAGVGKTRLVAEFVAQARDAGALVLMGGCSGFAAADLPYAPVMQALRPLSTAPSESVGAGLDEPGARALNEFLRSVSVPAAAPTEMGGQTRLFGELLGVLGRVAGERAVVVVVEDLHWADRSTLAFLAFVLGNVGRERLMLVMTLRRDGPDAGAVTGWLVEQRRNPALRELPVPPLDRDELAELLASLSGAPVTAAVVDAVFLRSKGNPFYAEELWAAREAGDGAVLPDTLRDALLVQLAGLSPAAWTVLGLIAAVGQPLGHQPVARAVESLGIDEDRLVTALHEGLDRSVLTVTGRGEYEFRHALMSEAVFDQLLPAERRRRHALVAEALAQGHRPAAVTDACWR